MRWDEIDARLTQAQETKKKEELKKRFDTVVGKNFYAIPLGCQFKAKTPGIDSFSVLPPASAEARSTAVVVFWNEKGKEVHETASLTKDGRVSLPPRLAKKISPDALMSEVLDNLQAVDLDFWVSIDEEILPPGRWLEDRERTEEPRRRPEEPVLDREQVERIRFLREQPGVAFGFLNKREGGFNGYRGFVFCQGFVVLEHPLIGNAAYILDGTPVLPEGRLDETTKDAFLGKDWMEWLRLSRPEHIALGTTRILHTGVTWKVRLQAELDRRLQVKKVA